MEVQEGGTCISMADWYWCLAETNRNSVKQLSFSTKINKLKKNMETKQHSIKKNVSLKTSKMNSENISRQMKIKTQLSKFLGCSRISSKRKDYIDTWLVLRNKQTKISNNQPNLSFKQNIKRKNKA